MRCSGTCTAHTCVKSGCQVLLLGGAGSSIGTLTAFKLSAGVFFAPSSVSGAQVLRRCGQYTFEKGLEGPYRLQRWDGLMSAVTDKMIPSIALLNKR